MLSLVAFIFCLHRQCMSAISIFFFSFNATATTEIYTLSLHDALPISLTGFVEPPRCLEDRFQLPFEHAGGRSEEHTSELQSRRDLVCRLLLEKKNRDFWHFYSFSIRNACLP